MIDRIIELSIRHRWAVTAAAVVLALAGVVAVYHTPMDAIPDVSENQVIVFADWPGHSPREIEDQIAYPLSTSLQGLPGVRVVRCSSEFNFASVSVILQDGVDFYFARQQIAERLARASGSLPGGAKAYLAPDGAATGQIFWYTIEGKDYDLARLRSIQDWYVRGQLASVPGVAEVASVGGRVLEYQIELDPRRLADAGLTPGMVTQAVADSNASVGGQVIEKANAEYLVRGIGWLGARPNRTGDNERSEADSPAMTEHERIRHDLEEVVMAAADGGAVRLADVATVSVGSKFRRGVLEMHGNEAVGGVVLMRYGENPLEVTNRLRAKITELAVGLPPGVRVVPAYDRTPLITGAVSTVTGALLEAMATASICVLAVLLHFRTSLVITLTLPLAALSAFVAMWLLRWLGIADIQTNIMSLAGIVVSIGVLVDSSIVMAENVMHVLKRHFGDRPVEGDVRWLVLPACRTVGRPIFFSVAIMLISFLPVFCLGGIDGKMFRPLAATKSLAMLAVGCLSITLVPALATIFIRGRLRDERQSWLVRTFADVYRPVLDYCLSHPAPLVWLLGVTFLAGCAPLGHRGLMLALLLVFIGLLGAITRTWRAAIACTLTLTLVALAAERNMRPLLWERTPPLNEGMVMDMPITVPRASITEAADDLKARDMVLCRFPEVAMVMGKAGRAETPTDPAPVDMIETMVEFRPRELWPKRKLTERDARRQTSAVLAALAADGAIEGPADGAAERKLVEEATAEALTRFNGVMREYAYQRNLEFEDSLPQNLVKWLVDALIVRLERQQAFVRPPASGEIAQVAQGLVSHADHHLAASPELDDVTSLARHAGHTFAGLGLVKEGVQLFENKPAVWQRAIDLATSALGKTPPTFFTRLTDDVLARHRAAWRQHVRELNGELFTRGTESYTRLAIEEVLTRATISDPKLADYLEQVRRFRLRPLPQHQAHQHRGRLMNMAPPPDVPPQPKLKSLQERLASTMRWRALLWPSEPADLSEPGGELDLAVRMPGWANVWTRPIQNRVDMLFTGVNTDIGVRVLGRELDDVVRASQEIASVLKQVPGSGYVMAEEIRGKGYLEIYVDREKASQLGVSVGDVNDVIETALGGKLATTTFEGRERHGVRVLYARNWREDEETIRGLPVPRRTAGGDVALSLRERARVRAAGTNEEQIVTPSMPTVPLADVADVRIVEGPASIKSENGLLRNYVRLNVRGRSPTDFIDEARRALADQVVLPPGVYPEWTGQFEHEVQAAATLTFVLPLVIGLILAILYWTYHDLADALLMLLAVPGAMAGGVLFQWLLGYDFSVTVLVGYIACFGMATSTGIIMLVYLREAVARRGGIERMSLADLRQAVMEGAVHRLRPKLLTEGTTILGLAPMLWATGTGAEVIKPMAAPVLGGILIADEVIDLLLPVLFYWVRRQRILWRSAPGDAGPIQPDLQTPDVAITSRKSPLPLGEG
ncbi:MAG TPA: efflux RND transporter permease subunit [Pirellulales bacterium]|jgi:Cu(I)/Ag(I) efflux system membrane protein CusA/SilA|nr:efflux RND transporter permease subunit [Pirellulales bacterium]